MGLTKLLPFSVKAALRAGFATACLAGLFGLTACTSAVDDTQRSWMNTGFRPYVPDVIQGNFISSEQYSKLQLGMSREQVKQIMGTPLLADYFHANRWDYIFEFKRQREVVGKERRITIFFENDKVVKFEGDALPTEAELVAEIDGYAKSKRSFWDMVTGKNKNPVTTPLQQPEVLIPSPTVERSWWEKLTGQNKPPEVVVPQAPVSSVAVPVAAPTSEVKPSERSWWQRLTGQNKPPEAITPEAAVVQAPVMAAPVIVPAVTPVSVAPAEVASPQPSPIEANKPAERTLWQRLTGQNKPPEVVAPAPVVVAPPVPTPVVEDKPAERTWWQRLTGQNKPVPAATAESQQMDLPAVNPMNNSPTATSRP